MGDPRFGELRDELLQAGVAPRNIQRALLEMEDHCRQLVDDEVSHGTDETVARSEAHRQLGSNQDLVRHYAAQPLLLAWSRRWPAIWFTLVALAAYFALSISSLVFFCFIVKLMSDLLRHVHVAPTVTFAIDLVARIVLLWLFPLLVTIAFGVRAYRRRVAPRWPIAGIVVLSALVSLINFHVTITGGSEPGEFGAGIGFSTQSLPGQLTHALVLASLVSVPLWLAMRRGRCIPG